MKLFNRRLSPDAEVGGGAPASGASSAAPAVAPDPGPAPAPAGDSAQPPPQAPEAQSAAGAGAQSPEDSYVPMPGDPGSQEWNDAFLKLDYDQRRQVEMGQYKPAAAAAPAAAPAPKEAPLPGDKPVEGQPESELAWNAEEFEQLDPKSKAIVGTLMDQVDQLNAQIEQSPGNQQTMDLLKQDPFIAMRLDQLAKGADPRAIPEQLKVPFNPASVITSELLADFGLDASDTESVAKLGNVIGAAFNAGVERAAQKAQYLQTTAVEEVKLQTRVASEVNDLVKELAASNEPMRKALDSKLNVSDPTHPIQQFIGWAAENLDNKFLGQHSMKVAYATYMAATGGLDKAMANVAKTTRERLILQLEKAQDQVRTVGRDAQRPSAANVNVAGIDTERYKADPAYAHSVYESARMKGDMQQMRKLEVFANTGRWPD